MDVEALRKRSLKNYLLGFMEFLPPLLTVFKYHLCTYMSDWIDAEEGEIEYRVAKLQGRALLKRMRHEVTVEGVEHLRGLDYFAVVSNHASYLDFAVLLGYFPSNLRFIAKRELKRVPMIGSHLARRGVLIEREGKKETLQAIEDAIGDSNKTPILLFAEGTRSVDGVPRRFKRGGLNLFVKQHVPLIPVTIINTFAYLPRGALRYRKEGRFKLIIGAPLKRAMFASNEAMMDAVERVVHETFHNVGEDKRPDTKNVLLGNSKV